MAEVVGEFGSQHKRDELVMTCEFNLEELCDLQSRYHNDGFERDIGDAITRLAEAEERREEVRAEGLGIAIMLE